MDRYRNSLAVQRRILEIALGGEFSQYDLPETTGKSYRTTTRHIKDLEKAGLIVLLREEPSMKGGNPKKIYGITPKGVQAAHTEDALCPLCKRPQPGGWR